MANVAISPLSAVPPFTHEGVIQGPLSGDGSVINNAAFLNAIGQVIEPNALTLGTGQASPQTGAFNNEGLLALNTPILLLFNEAFIEAANQNVDADLGSFSPEQLQAASILQKDVASLEEAANLTAVPLSANTTTVDLSIEAQNIVNGLAPPPVVATPAPLTNLQLAQIGEVLQPAANQPLTPELVTQIQTQLNKGQNSVQLSLDMILQVMNYMAGLQNAASRLAEVKVEARDRTVINPVSPIDRVAAEDSTIL